MREKEEREREKERQEKERGEWAGKRERDRERERERERKRLREEILREKESVKTNLGIIYSSFFVRTAVREIVNFFPLCWRI
jgi:hypothetical protein